MEGELIQDSGISPETLDRLTEIASRWHGGFGFMVEYSQAYVEGILGKRILFADGQLYEGPGTVSDPRNKIKEGTYVTPEYLSSLLDSGEFVPAGEDLAQMYLQQLRIQDGVSYGEYLEPPSYYSLVTPGS